MLDWLTANSLLLGWLFGLSVGSLIVTAIALPIVIVRLPADYFAPTPAVGARLHRSFWNILWHVAKNALGVLFVLAGIAMLVLPGQGILTMLIGVLLLDFPGKQRLERWLIRRRGVLAAMNRLRSRFGKDALWL